MSPSRSVVWINASRPAPCRICSKGDWCRSTDDGSVVDCYRQSAPGATQCSDAQGRPFWRLRAAHDRREDDAALPDSTVDATVGQVVPRFAAAEVGVRHAVYSTLLSELRVRPDHEQALRNRGLTPAEIDRLGYRSAPAKLDEWLAIRQVLRKHDVTVLVTVPGLSLYPFEEGGTKGELRLDCPDDALLIPSRDLDGRIHGVQIRRADGHYMPLTAWTPFGARAVLGPHVPLHDAAEAEVVRLTEGRIKADIATLKTGVLTIGCPCAGAFTTAFGIVEALKAKTVLLAPDADARSNSAVAAGLASDSSAYAARGYDLVLETWPVDAGKGLDDVAHAGHVGRVERLTAIRLWSYVRDVIRSAGAPSVASVDSRLTLLPAVERVVAGEVSQAFRADVAVALAALDDSSVEYQRTHEIIMAKLDKTQAKAFARALKSAGKTLDAAATKRKLEALEASGARLFRLGDSQELRDAVLDDLCPVGGTGFDHGLVVYDESMLHRYTGDGVWTPLRDSEVINHVAAYSGSPVGSLDGAPLRISASLCEGVAKLVKWKSDTPGFFAAPPAGIAFRNGFLVLDPKTGKASLKGHSRDHRARYRYDFDYEPTATPKKYLAFLARLCRNKPADEARDTIACILQHHGACLTGLAPRFGIALFFLGAANTGKSKLVEMITRTMPPGSTANVMPQQMGDPVFVARLAGKLLNTYDDLPEREILDAGNLKSIITGNKVQGAAKYCDPFDFRPQAGHIYNTNKLSRTADTTGGFRRRVAVLRFDSPIEKAEQNRQIADEIINEELSAIVALSISAVGDALRANELTVPASSEAIVDDWLAWSSPIDTYFAERLVVGKAIARDEWTDAASIYDDYVAWCDAGGNKKLSKISVGRELRERLGVSRDECRRNNGPHYPVRLRRAVENEENQRSFIAAMDDIPLAN